MENQLGKIVHVLFEQFMGAKFGCENSDVLAGPQFGVDVSVVSLPGNMAMALTSDPLSLIPSLGLEESAWLSVHLMANDMATTGYGPQFGQFVLNLPDTFSSSDFSIYWNYIHTFCKNIGVAITGGHTGFIAGQNSTIAGGGTFVSVGKKSKMRLSKNAKPGQVLLLSKSCAISSAAILAMSFPETVKNKVGMEVQQAACGSFYETSSLPDALAAVGESNQYTEVTAMHDVTEGGVLGAVYELATASGCGVNIFEEKLPIGEIQKHVCDVFSLDPRYCIGAGAMLFACEANHAQIVIDRLIQKGINCTEIGVLTEAGKGINSIENEVSSPIVYKQDDPYWVAFFKALNAGWK
jgi:hydrogenase expression/formation protein HypE